MTVDPTVGTRNIEKTLPVPDFNAGKSYSHSNSQSLARKRAAFRRDRLATEFNNSKVSIVIKNVALLGCGLIISFFLLAPGILFFPRGLLFVIFGLFSLVSTIIIAIQNFSDFRRKYKRYGSNACKK